MAVFCKCTKKYPIISRRSGRVFESSGSSVWGTASFYASGLPVDGSAEPKPVYPDPRRPRGASWLGSPSAAAASRAVTGTPAGWMRMSGCRPPPWAEWPWTRWRTASSSVVHRTESACEPRRQPSEHSQQHCQLLVAPTWASATPSSRPNVSAASPHSIGITEPPMARSPEGYLVSQKLCMYVWGAYREG